MAIDGKYLPPVDVQYFCDLYNIPYVPFLGIHKYNFDELKKLTDGPTTLNGGPHMREGIVVRPLEETLDKHGRRKIMKFIGDEYLMSKYSDEDTTDV
jgi:hypothetical protein